MVVHIARHRHIYLYTQILKTTYTTQLYICRHNQARLMYTVCITSARKSTELIWCIQLTRLHIFIIVLWTTWYANLMNLIHVMVCHFWHPAQICDYSWQVNDLDIISNICKNAQTVQKNIHFILIVFCIYFVI